jgi:hypothetical protein
MKKHSGFSIASAMVGMVIVSMGAIALYTLIDNARKGQKGIQNSVDFDVLKSSIQLVLAKPALCAGAFRTQTNTPAKFPTSQPSETLHQLMMGTSPIVQMDQLITGGLTIKKLELSQVTGTASSLAAGIRTYIVQLVVEAEKASGLGGNLLSNAKNPFRFSLQTLDATGVIQGCGTVTAPIEFFSSTAAVSRNPIVMNAGNAYEGAIPATAWSNLGAADIDIPVRPVNSMVSLDMSGYLNWNGGNPATIHDYQIELRYSKDGGATWSPLAYTSTLFAAVVPERGTSYSLKASVALNAGQSLMIRPRFRSEVATGAVPQDDLTTANLHAVVYPNP